MPPHTSQKNRNLFSLKIIIRWRSKSRGTVRDTHAVIPPNWYMLAGDDAKSYLFIIAMSGENQEFEGMEYASMSLVK